MDREKLKDVLTNFAHSCNCTLGQMIFMTTGMTMLVGSVLPSPGLYLTALVTGSALAWTFRGDLRN